MPMRRSTRSGDPADAGVVPLVRPDRSPRIVGPDLSRRRFLAFVVAAPVLTVAVRAIDDIAGPFQLPAAAATGGAGSVVARLLRRLRSHRRVDPRRAPHRVSPQDPDHRAEPGRGPRAPGGGRSGNHDRDGDPRGRGARRRARHRRRRPRRRAPRAVVEPAHRRIELGARALHADAHRCRGNSGPTRNRGRATFRRRRIVAHDARFDGRRPRRAHRDLRVVVGRGREGHGPRRFRHAEGSERLHPDRQARDPPRRT